MSQSIDQQIKDLETQIYETQQKISELMKQRDAEPVNDYTFRNKDGSEVKLSELFGDKDDLIVVHNMGKGCRYCTLWADGFIGFVPHLSDRASFVVSSADDHETMKTFAESRGWNFRIMSAADGPFKSDMGFADDKGNPWPGVSAFHREADGSIHRTGSAPFGPGDKFCAVWHFFDLLKDGPNKWEPQYTY